MNPQMHSIGMTGDLTENMAGKDSGDTSGERARLQVVPSQVDQELSVLVVDESPQRMEFVMSALRASGYEHVQAIASSDDLTRSVRNIEPDVILIDVEAPSRDTLEHIAEVSSQMPRPIVMFTKEAGKDMIGDAIRAGVSAYVVDGLNFQRVKPVIEVAIARFKEFDFMRVELNKAKASLEERKFIDRAKGIMMDQLGCSEKEAYKLLQRSAMDRKMKMIDIAKRLIQASDNGKVSKLKTQAIN